VRGERATVLMPAGPLTVGTAGHVDHGKTALVAALTGTDTDRLPQEKARGLSIELGFAAVSLPSGRAMSLVDVPGHERFIRTMVAGVTGIDAYLMVIAASEGVREQTVEHARILRALGIDAGLVIVTKTDLAAPDVAAEQARELLPGVRVIICPPRTADRRAPVIAALERLALELPGRASTPAGPAILHVDRCFTVAGAGTVVTGTLVSGAVGLADRLTLYPHEREVRVRGLQVHGAPVPAAVAGQRVAINLARVPSGGLERGDALAAAGALRPSFVVDVAADALDGDPPSAVHAHHGTRVTAARVVRRPGAGIVRLRCRRPLLIAPGDVVVLRDAAGRRTLGGVVCVTPPRPAPVSVGDTAPCAARPQALGLAERLGPAELARVEAEIRAAIAAEGRLTLPGLRDRLGVSRRQAKAFLDYFDAVGLTRRRADDTRVLRRRAAPPTIGAVDPPVAQP
jgi:selenocysteine-specific elongation factor